MRALPLQKAFTLIEPGPVVLVTTQGDTGPNIMTISWTMVLDFTPKFSITTGAWNHSFAALATTRHCVLAIPTADMIDTVVGIGMCSGADTDKFSRFGLTPIKSKKVSAPRIKQCLANIECRVTDILAPHNIIVLEGVAASYDETHTDKRLLHAVGDGTFIADGRKFDRRAMMAEKIPPGV